MAITYVGGQVGGRAGSTSTSNVTFSLSGGISTTPRPGDLVIIGVTVASQARTPACAVSGYTAQTQINANGTTYDTSLNVSYKFMGITPDTTFTLPSTGNIADAQRYTVQVWSGVDPTTPLDVAMVSASGTGTGRPNPGSITPTSSGAYVGIIGAGAAATGAAYTAPANYTTGFLTGTTADTNDAMIGSGYRSWTSGAEDPAQYTGGTTNAVDSWAAFTYALKPEVSYLPTLISTEVLALGTAASPGAQNITVPTGTQLVVVHAANYASAGDSTLSLSSDFAGTFTVYSDGDTFGDSVYVAHAVVSSTGAKTITPTWSNTLTGGPLFIISYIKDIDTSSYLRDVGVYSTGSASATASDTLATLTTDLLLVLDKDGTSIPTAISGYTSQTTQTNNAEYGRLQTCNAPGAAATTITTVGTNYACLGAIALRGVASVTQYTLTAQGGSYTLSGGSGILKRSKLITANGGSYTLTGQQAVLTWAPNLNNYVLTALGGSYNLTGSSVQISRNRKLTSSGGSYTLLGATAALRRSKLITALGGSYTQTGSSVIISRNRKLTAQGGAYSITGSPANIFRNRVLTSQGGSYTISGQDIVITWTGTATAYNLICQGGSYSLTGSSVTILRNRNLSATSGVYISTGSSATISKSKIIVAQGGSYSLSGQSITLSRNRLLVVNGGSYSITGNTATITWATAGGAVWPSPSLVLLGTVYGPTGSEYTGTLDLFGIKYDITTGQLVKPINDKVVMTL